MEDALLLRKVFLGPAHRSTGATKHTIAGKPMVQPSELRIIRHHHEPGYYLLYCDSDGKDMTDTWHEREEDALAQAEFEFRVTPSDWTIIHPSTP